MRTLKILALTTLSIMTMVSMATAGSSCSASKSASNASNASTVKLAGASCSYKSAPPSDMSIEAVRMPSGALAVFYTGETEVTVAKLQAQASNGAENFCCGLASSMAKNDNVNVEVVEIANGVMMLVTAETADVLDEYESQYEVAMAAISSEADGE